MTELIFFPPNNLSSVHVITSLGVTAVPPLNETYIEQRFAALLPLEGSFRLGEGLFDLNTYLLYFCSLMWYSPAITLICGQSQVKCIYHIHTQTHRPQ